jgi:hypothetical protein
VHGNLNKQTRIHKKKRQSHSNDEEPCRQPSKP